MGWGQLAWSRHILLLHLKSVEWVKNWPWPFVYKICIFKINFMGFNRRFTGDVWYANSSSTCSINPLGTNSLSMCFLGGCREMPPDQSWMGEGEWFTPLSGTLLLYLCEWLQRPPHAAVFPENLDWERHVHVFMYFKHTLNIQISTMKSSAQYVKYLY